MVIFVDLEDESEPPESVPHWSQLQQHGGIGSMLSLIDLSLKDGLQHDRGNPNKNAITEALGCYPYDNSLSDPKSLLDLAKITISIASHIDLNTLDALSLTCRQIRANLLQFRTQLLTSTLHCENEDVELDPEHTFRYRARAADWYFVETGRDAHGIGKVGDCARDMVGGCRRCGRVVCRNCTIKPPAPVLLHNRHRRLCTACQRAPLSALVGPMADSSPQRSRSPKPSMVCGETFKSTVCTCPSDGVWLCQPCGRSLRSADTEYESIWKWRTRYLPSLGGLGVGIGEGNRGVPCGRGGDCIAAREVEQETDCDAEDAREVEINSRSVTPSSSPGSTTGSISGSQMGPGYARHEIEGIGGVMKKKLVKMVKVGACVAEFGDEKELGRFLVREKDGKARSWCGWCWRVVPGAKDITE